MIERDTIAETIKEIQNEAKQADSSMVEAPDSVELGMRANEEVGAALLHISQSVEDVSAQITQLAAASEEPSTAAEQISKNVDAISPVTHESAAGTQQIARAAEDLNRLTENLQELLRKFMLTEHGRIELLPAERGSEIVRSNTGVVQARALRAG